MALHNSLTGTAEPLFRAASWTINSRPSLFLWASLNCHVPVTYVNWWLTSTRQTVVCWYKVNQPVMKRIHVYARLWRPYPLATLAWWLSHWSALSGYFESTTMSLCLLLVPNELYIVRLESANKVVASQYKRRHRHSNLHAPRQVHVPISRPCMNPLDTENVTKLQNITC